MSHSHYQVIHIEAIEPHMIFNRSIKRLLKNEFEFQVVVHIVQNKPNYLPQILIKEIGTPYILYSYAMESFRNEKIYNR